MLSGYFRYAVRMLPERCPDVAEIRIHPVVSVYPDSGLSPVSLVGGSLPQAVLAFLGHWA